MAKFDLGGTESPHGHQGGPEVQSGMFLELAFKRSLYYLLSAPSLMSPYWKFWCTTQ